MSFLKNIFQKTNTDTVVIENSITPNDNSNFETESFDSEYLLTAPEIVGWLSVQEQELLFSALLWPSVVSATDSILDVGCGRADLFGFLKRITDNVSYKGIDLNNNLIEIAKTKYPGVDVSAIDLMSYTPEIKFDWVMGSGLFNLNDHPNMVEYAKECIDKMYSLSTKGVAFNLLTGVPSDLAQSDIDQLIVHDSGSWLNYLIEKYTTVLVRSDYMSGDITFFILK